MARVAQQLRTMVKKHDSVVELSLTTVNLPAPKSDEVVVRVEASPINPSDLGLLLGPADKATIRRGTGTGPSVVADIPREMMRALAQRFDKALPAGNEGAGVVVEAGSSPEAQALLGKTVGVIGGGMYSQYRVVKAAQCLAYGAGVTPAEGASWFVNPLTVLGMVGTMKLEGHKALVHTAAASNLGQMLVKVCNQDNIGLVNIVRKKEHVDILHALGAKHVLNSSEPDFMKKLIDALVATGATLAFDATGGGQLASQILTCMEAAAMQGAKDHTIYGSVIHKQVYIYGGLERSPTMLTRNFGMKWGIGGWLLSYFLERVGQEETQKLWKRVADEIKTTFASSYVKELSLAEALDPAVAKAYSMQATGEKVLVNPNKDVPAAAASKL